MESIVLCKEGVFIKESVLPVDFKYRNRYTE